MTTERQLNPTVPADAVEILDRLLAGIRMDGLTGSQVAAMLASLNTLRQAHKPEEAAK